MRRCAWSREAAPRDELLRLVLDRSGRAYVDLRGVAPGRGVYIVPDADVVGRALSPKGLGRLFRGRAAGFGPVGESADGAVAAIEELLLRRAVELVALARRAGQLEIGFEAVVEAVLKSPSGTTLVLAEDLAEGSRQSVEQAVERAKWLVRRRRFGTKSGLGSAMGRGETGILLCKAGALADRIGAEGARLGRLRGQEVAFWRDRPAVESASEAADDAAGMEPPDHDEHPPHMRAGTRSDRSGVDEQRGMVRGSAVDARNCH